MAEDGKNGNSRVESLWPVIEEFIRNKNWNALKTAIVPWHTADIADLLRKLDIRDRMIVLRLLPKKMQSDVFSEFDSDIQEDMLKQLTNEDTRSIIVSMEPDDRAELFEETSPEIMRRLVSLLPPKERQETLELLGYPADSVGRLMTPDYVAIKQHWTIEEAIEHIRRFGRDAETIDMIYVVDDDWRLLDDIPIRRLILADPRQSVELVMDQHFVSVIASVDQEEAVKLFDKYNLTALPVADSDGHLLGIVTVDDVIDVLREEQTEDVTRLAAIEATPISLDLITKIREVPLKKIVRARITWLLALLGMDLATGGIIQGFQNTIAMYVVLVTFLPVLVDTAGNAGSQSATLVIRALALGTVKARDWSYLLARELLVAGALGTMMALGISVMGFIRGGSLLIAQVVVLAMIVNVMLGSVIGLSLPFLFTKFNKDPAMASTPLITTLADILGTGTYLGIAYLLLG